MDLFCKSVFGLRYDAETTKNSESDDVRSVLPRGAKGTEEWRSRSQVEEFSRRPKGTDKIGQKQHEER